MENSRERIRSSSIILVPEYRSARISECSPIGELAQRRAGQRRAEESRYLRLILCTVCLRSRGEYFFRPFSLSFSGRPPLTLIWVR